MVGSRAEVVDACEPRGRVRIHGELWDAHCAAGAAVGDAVRVVSVDRLSLEVERLGERFL
jgi:membrane-bound serine protease (ClpP class)